MADDQFFSPEDTVATQHDLDLLHACEIGSVNGTVSALSHGANPNAITKVARLTGQNFTGHDMLSPLSIAVLNGHAGLIPQLVEAGACVHIRTKSGMSPLMLALLKADLASTVALIQLECGGDSNNNACRAQGPFPWCRPTGGRCDKEDLDLLSNVGLSVKILLTQTNPDLHLAVRDACAEQHMRWML